MHSGYLKHSSRWRESPENPQQVTVTIRLDQSFKRAEDTGWGVAGTSLTPSTHKSPGFNPSIQRDHDRNILAAFPKDLGLDALTPAPRPLAPSLSLFTDTYPRADTGKGSLP